MKVGRTDSERSGLAALAAAVLWLGVGLGLYGAGGQLSAETPGHGPLTVVDQAGRRVSVPDPIKTVWCTSPAGTNLIYVLAPDMLVGWNISPTAREKKYIPERYRAVTGMGGWFGKNTTGNVEEIIKRAPDVVFSVGSLDEAAVSEVERIQKLIHIPVVMVNGTLPASGDALRFIGKLLKVEARAKELADYCDDVIAEARRVSSRLTDAAKVRVYYAEGREGLNTDPEGSWHTEVLALVGGANVARSAPGSSSGMAPVSLEQVLIWDPKVVLVASDPAGESDVYEQITTDARWATVRAVKEGRVYEIPRGPFDWFDRPPSISRILGVRWLGHLLYPGLFTGDINGEIRSFYRLFFHIDLTEAQLRELIARAMPKEAGDR